MTLTVRKQVRFAAAQLRQIAKYQAKYHLSFSDVVRIAIAKLMEAEGIQ